MMMITFTELIAQKTGLNIEHVLMANWSETRSLVDHQEVELVSAAQKINNSGRECQSGKQPLLKPFSYSLKARR
ncbi:hypothetical protein OK016_24475 [Vibrio chagasii]|nr:hypothetical protein [Vibrio chagasii]